ncbi:hypothetical protein GCM10017643_18620 [Ancylobacter dichloromethanicus]|uniref:Uncharacterized protein n=2 Tax=Ancylobacter dichloromethanicus TaxID=518825 RepID=A0A9W6J6N4_9HYPH|nr:hypothetical protein GCM10017643_18620 [Ancylobacter dichloromethanicus]
MGSRGAAPGMMAAGTEAPNEIRRLVASDPRPPRLRSRSNAAEESMTRALLFAGLFALVGLGAPSVQAKDLVLEEFVAGRTVAEGSFAAVPGTRRQPLLPSNAGEKPCAPI